MTPTEILEELRKLPANERLGIIEAALHLTRKEMQQGEQSPNWTEEQRQMAAAAKALLADYTTDKELTAFTALDSEDFYD